MSCLLKKEEGKANAILTFKRDRLIYDIENYAYIEGSVMETENSHNRHTVADVGQEGNIDRVSRKIDLAVAKCKEMLYPYTKHEVHKPVLDNRMKAPSTYAIVLTVPEGFSQTTLILLERLIHEYIVCMAVADWMSITNPSKTETWREKAEEAATEIRTSLRARLGNVRRKPHPF